MSRWYISKPERSIWSIRWHQANVCWIGAARTEWRSHDASFAITLGQPCPFVQLRHIFPVSDSYNLLCHTLSNRSVLHIAFYNVKEKRFASPSNARWWVIVVLAFTAKNHFHAQQHIMATSLAPKPQELNIPPVASVTLSIGHGTLFNSGRSTTRSSCDMRASSKAPTLFGYVGQRNDASFSASFHREWYHAIAKTVRAIWVPVRQWNWWSTFI